MTGRHDCIPHIVLYLNVKFQFPFVFFFKQFNVINVRSEIKNDKRNEQIKIGLS